MIFATDLDKTLIYSYRHLTKRQPVYMVEEKEGKPISYMTTKAVNALWKLKQRPDLKFIPVTARSTEQFNRITVTRDCPYAIVASGATILENDKPMKSWDNIVTNIREQNSSIYELFMKYLSLIDSPHDSLSDESHKFPSYFEIKPRLVNDSVIFFKLTENAATQSLLPMKLQDRAKKYGWNFTLQGQKGYLAPKDISKENALKFLADYLHESNIITAGDGELDVEFIKLGNVLKFIPEDSEAYQHKDECSPCVITSNGIDDVHIMLDIISRINIKEN